jgi:hypothetical protein
MSDKWYFESTDGRAEGNRPLCRQAVVVTQGNQINNWESRRMPQEGPQDKHQGSQIISTLTTVTDV